MALTHTPPLEKLICPEFKLLATNGKTYQKSDFKSKYGALFMFICNHCPYVKAIEDRLIDLGQFLKQEGFPMVGISSNDAEKYQEDSYPQLKKRAEEKNYPFVYLYDEDQSVAQKFGAVCTPDFFLFNSSFELVYRGQLDDSWKDPSKVTRQDLKLAILDLMAGRPVNPQQISSMGCSIKWKTPSQNGNPPHL